MINGLIFTFIIVGFICFILPTMIPSGVNAKRSIYNQYPTTEYVDRRTAFEKAEHRMSTFHSWFHEKTYERNGYRFFRMKGEKHPTYDLHMYYEYQLYYDGTGYKTAKFKLGWKQPGYGGSFIDPSNGFKVIRPVPNKNTNLVEISEKTYETIGFAFLSIFAPEYMEEATDLKIYLANHKQKG